jgi:Flp pilus assembly protein TadG
MLTKKFINDERGHFAVIGSLLMSVLLMTAFLRLNMPMLHG